jgi:hypothetical protein
MFGLLGIMTVAGGLFLFLWYRTVAGLPVKQRPQFSRPLVFKWGVPAVSISVFAAGIYLLAEVGWSQAAIAAGAAALVTFLIIRFDRYSATMRLIHDHYRKVRRANPDMEEIEALFQTAAWRYPKWSHDRLLELVAGKTIEELVLVVVLNEYEINPISDWELYRTLKAKAALIVHPGR